MGHTKRIFKKYLQTTHSSTHFFIVDRIVLKARLAEIRIASGRSHRRFDGRRLNRRSGERIAACRDQMFRERRGGRRGKADRIRLRPVSSWTEWTDFSPAASPRRVWSILGQHFWSSSSWNIYFLILEKSKLFKWFQYEISPPNRKSHKYFKLQIKEFSSIKFIYQSFKMRKESYFYILNSNYLLRFQESFCWPEVSEPFLWLQLGVV